MFRWWPWTAATTPPAPSTYTAPPLSAGGSITRSAPSSCSDDGHDRGAHVCQNIFIANFKISALHCTVFAYMRLSRAGPWKKNVQKCVRVFAWGKNVGHWTRSFFPSRFMHQVFESFCFSNHMFSKSYVARVCVYFNSCITFQFHLWNVIYQCVSASKISVMNI